MKKLKIAIVGASGLVGENILKLLENEEVCLGEPILLCSDKSVGKKYSFKGKILRAETVNEKSFEQIDLAFFATDEKTSKKLVPQALKKGCVVIDNAPAFRQKKEVPLIVPEINFCDYLGQKLISNPNCTTAQSTIALYPLVKKFGLKSVFATTYQSVSGYGKEGIKALKASRKADFLPLTNEEKTLSEKHFHCDIKSNCIPTIGELLSNGYTTEELKLKNETRKILGDGKLRVSAFCTRVPVEYCHGVFLRAQFKSDFLLSEALSAFREFKPVKLIERDSEPQYPLNDLARGKNEVFIGRVRKPCKKTLEFYAVADNLLRGAAYNAVEICKKIAALKGSI